MGKGTIAFVLMLAATSSLRAQSGSPRLNLILPPRPQARVDMPSTSIAGVLAEGHRRDLLNSGWSTAIHARLEIWTKRGFLNLFYGRESMIEWDIVIDYSPASKIYHLRRVTDDRVDTLGVVTSIEAAEQLLQRPYRAALSPGKRGSKYFYVFGVDISTLSLSDLEAWQRWLRGEAQPAVQGKKSPATAFQRGLGSLLSRVLGGETQSYETRSDIFTAG